MSLLVILNGPRSHTMVSDECTYRGKDHVYVGIVTHPEALPCMASHLGLHSRPPPRVQDLTAAAQLARTTIDGLLVPQSGLGEFLASVANVRAMQYALLDVLAEQRQTILAWKLRCMLAVARHADAMVASLETAGKAQRIALSQQAGELLPRLDALAHARGYTSLLLSTVNPVSPAELLAMYPHVVERLRVLTRWASGTVAPCIVDLVAVHVTDVDGAAMGTVLQAQARVVNVGTGA